MFGSKTVPGPGREEIPRFLINLAFNSPGFEVPEIALPVSPDDAGNAVQKIVGMEFPGEKINVPGHGRMINFFDIPATGSNQLIIINVFQDLFRYF